MLTTKEEQQKINQITTKLQLYLEKNQFRSTALLQAPPIYYKQPLSWRKDYLKAPSERYLCKTIVMENKQWRPKTDSSIYNPRYICIVVQYTAKLNMIKLHLKGREIQNKNVPKENQIGRSGFNYRLVRPEIQAELTGYGFNGVTPFDFATKENIPMILSDKLVDLEFFYLGGGHPDVKLRISTQEFIEKQEQRVFVADISDERPESEWGIIEDESEPKEQPKLEQKQEEIKQEEEK